MLSDGPIPLKISKAIRTKVSSIIFALHDASNALMEATSLQAFKEGLQSKRVLYIICHLVARAKAYILPLWGSLKRQPIVYVKLGHYQNSMDMPCTTSSTRCLWL
ncbi:VIR_N domain-containing protein [Psidium guajava]|nr:VIR_N domain-containing protein [Psidium guajava]